jgi:uncharacterized membrane protein (UPF0182 family)
MSQPSAGVSQRRISPTAIAVSIIALIVIVLVSAAGIYTDWLWFGQAGYQSVFLTQILAQVIMFAIAFVVMSLVTFLSLMLAWRSRPIYLRLPGDSPFEQYQQLLDGLRRVIMFGVPLGLGVLGGLAASAQWSTALLYLNGSPTGTVDPQFGLDVSFYLFNLPMYTAAVAYLSAVVLLAGLTAGAVHLIYGGIRVTGRDFKVSKPARWQLSVTIAVYLAIQAVSLWLDQYGTVTSTNSLFTGASYTDVNAVIPALQIMALISVLVALLFLVTAVIGQWRFSILATALLVVSSIVLGGLYPWIVQTFQVVPNERTLEAPFLQRNIDATRVAYGLDGVQVVEYDAKTQIEQGALRSDAQTTASIRILDPALVSDAFRQLEQYRQYYSFPNRLHVDRYQINGETQDTVVAVRELNQAGLGASQSWYNSTIVYTHGFGLVGAYGNKRDTDGKPLFLHSGIPPIGLLGEFEPRIYFGMNSPTYSIVGGPEGSEPLEFDYPAGVDGERETYTTFAGEGGPNVGNIVSRIAYALKFQSEQILLSDAINPESQIIYNRNPIERVQLVAPYLTLDTEAYPAVVDGRVKWIIEGYTTSVNYPYSSIEGFNAAIIDSSTERGRFGSGNINYIRNSVKATVDAYDGKVDLYAWDTEDPILKAWMGIFPNTVQPIANISADLMSHMRYPSDLFKVQRSILGRYHVTEAGAFYSQQDAWMTPNDPVSGVGVGRLQPPYYLTMQAPGDDNPAFSLYSTFIPQSTGETTRNVLTGYLIANAEAGNQAGVINGEYGKLTLLNLPRETIVPGPGQVQNNFNADSQVSSLLNILRQGSTRVLNGNLLTLPVGGGLLYVQPVYIESTGETSYPLLQKILVAFGDRIAFEDTLDEALDSLFGGDSGASAGDSSNGGAPGTPTEPDEAGGAVSNAALESALERARVAVVDKQNALTAGNWQAFGDADLRLQQAIEDALRAIGR